MTPEKYIEEHTSPEDAVLHELFRQTHLRTAYPNMLSGPVLGKLLEFISYMIKPSLILEIGTFTGYSAICMARGLKEGGILHTIEVNEEYKGMAQEYFEKSGMADRITQHTGDAAEVIPKLKLLFDLVFIDAEKESYIGLYEEAIRVTRRGGFIIADNVLWGGKVIAEKNDSATKSISEFNNYVLADTRVENVMLPVRDSIMIMRVL